MDQQQPQDLAELERRLLARACWQSDPAAYREGVRDTLVALRDVAPPERRDGRGPRGVAV